MAEEKPSAIESVAGAVKGAVEAVPVYQDAVQPAAKEFGETIRPAGQELGQAIVTVAKVINVALAPLRGMVWSYERIEAFVQSRVAEKLKDVPAEDVHPPKSHVAVPTLLALSYTGDEPELRELYATLLAASLDIKTSYLAHPAFVEIIKQMAPDEARLMKFFAGPNQRFPIIHLRRKFKDGTGFQDVARNISNFGVLSGCQHPKLAGVYIDNLCRLGLIEIPENTWYIAKDAYNELEEEESMRKWKEGVNRSEQFNPDISRNLVRTTGLGRQFVAACIEEHSTTRGEVMK